jgi:hypothetical protein
MATFGSNRRFSQSRSAASVANVVPARALSRFLLTTLIASATAIGLWSLRYLLPSQPQAIRFENFTDRHTAFTIHAVFASIALLVGPWQFLPSIFFRRRRLHRLLGWGKAIPTSPGSAGYRTLSSRSGSLRQPRLGLFLGNLTVDSRRRLRCFMSLA